MKEEEEEGRCSNVKDDLKLGVGERNNLEFHTVMSAVLSRSTCAFKSVVEFDRKNGISVMEYALKLKIRAVLYSRYAIIKIVSVPNTASDQLL